MEITIVGWYGTETLGDRAILDGIFYLLEKAYGHCHIRLGSLKPFLTERTLWEDIEFYKQSAPNMSIEIFDVREEKNIKEAVSLSEMVIMGGGPLMDIDEMHIIEWVFCYAKRKKKKTILMGCGYGPINTKEFEDCFRRIIDNTDLAIFRDEFSKENAIKCNPNRTDIINLPDPAIFSVINYKNRSCEEKNDTIVVNFREYPNVYGEDGVHYFKDILNELERLDRKIQLVPMHTFFWGGDDRYFFSKLMYENKLNNVEILCNPLSLQEVYKLYENAYGCVGMRYHSIVFQTILNGNNLLIDYSGKQGKIQGFLDMYDKSEFYNKRLLGSMADKAEIQSFVRKLFENEKFSFSLEDYYETEYIKKLKE